MRNKQKIAKCVWKVCTYTMFFLYARKPSCLPVTVTGRVNRVFFFLYPVFLPQTALLSSSSSYMFFHNISSFKSRRNICPTRTAVSSSYVYIMYTGTRVCNMTFRSIVYTIYICWTMTMKSRLLNTKSRKKCTFIYEKRHSLATSSWCVFPFIRFGCWKS